MLVYGLTLAGEHCWDLARSLVWLGAGVALLLVFHVVESRSASPLVPVSVLRRRTVAWGNIAGPVAVQTETSLVFLMTLCLQEVPGYSPLAAGLTFPVLGTGTVLGGSATAVPLARRGTGMHDRVDLAPSTMVEVRQCDHMTV